MKQITNAQVKKYLDLFHLQYHKSEAKDYEDKEPFYSFKSEVIRDTNEEYSKLSDAMHEIQTDEETVYDQVVNCLEWLGEKTEDEPDGVDVDDLRDEMHEAVDSSVNVYTIDLTGWLHRTVYNVYYLSQALAEFGSPKDNDGFALLSIAQYLCHQEIWEAVLSILEEELEEEE